MSAEPKPLAPLGATDSWSYPNGVIAYYHEGVLVIHGGSDQAPVIIPSKLFPVIVAVATTMGLDETQAALIAEAAEAYA